MSYVQLSRRRDILAGPGPLPKTWRNITGFDKLAAAELARHGWHPWQPVPAPEVDPRTHKVASTIEVADGTARPRHAVVALSRGERHHLMAERRREMLAELAGVRWRHETAGIDFDGTPLHTDRESQATLALVAMKGRAERWKGADGKWRAMDAERLQAADQAVEDHKRACFAHEEALADAIRATDSIEALDEIDLEEGWP